MDHLPLMDRVNALTHARKFLGKPLDAAARQGLVTMGGLLRRAERYVVDDAAVRLTCHLSHELDRLPGWAVLARLPHDVVWLEMSLHAKVREFDAMGSLPSPFNPDEVSPQIGYLLCRDDPAAHPARWVACSFVINSEDGSALPEFYCYVFDPEGTAAAPVAGSAFWRAPTLSRLRGMPKIPVVADGIATELTAEYAAFGIFEGRARSRIHEVFGPKVGIVINPFWSSMFVSDRHTVQPERANLLVREVIEQCGVVRYLVTMLAAIGGLPRDVKPIATRAGRRLAHGVPLPYLRHSGISIKLPRDNRVLWARRALDREARGARRPWHSVAGHWVVAERGRSTRVCRHQPTMIEDGVAMCERCQLVIRWREFPNGRGDPTVGIVDHTYHVGA